MANIGRSKARSCLSLWEDYSYHLRRKKVLTLRDSVYWKNLCFSSDAEKACFLTAGSLLLSAPQSISCGIDFGSFAE
jgi:hypothetical protein